jgi:hypothetical protein
VSCQVKGPFPISHGQRHLICFLRCSHSEFFHFLRFWVVHPLDFSSICRHWVLITGSSGMAYVLMHFSASPWRNDALDPVLIYWSQVCWGGDDLLATYRPDFRVLLVERPVVLSTFRRRAIRVDCGLLVRGVDLCLRRLLLEKLLIVLGFDVILTIWLEVVK